MMLVFKETVLLSEWQCEREKIRNSPIHFFLSKHLFYNCPVNLL